MMRLSDFGQWAVRHSGRPKSPVPKVEIILKFAQLGLSEPILRAVTAEGYDVPTPIQVQAIPHVLSGRDLLGCAQTGTGKTAAFALPILDRLAASLPNHAFTAQSNHKSSRQERRPISVVILCPTRELAVQIGESFRAYGRYLPMRHMVIFGGVSQHHQVRTLQGGVDIVIATPGRLLDLMQQGHVDLGHVKVFALDEADRMLDMGFIHDIRRIVKQVPARRQTLLFSATMPPEIRALAASILHDPVSITVDPVSSTVETISQGVYHVQRANKTSLLMHILKRAGMHRTLVFTRTKHGADKVVRNLNNAGIRAEAIHGNKSQNARIRALTAFKSKTPPVLVATDIASRGLDVDGVTHVVNYDIPHEPETYVHRIGRTARAGASGVAISLCDAEERSDLKAIERLTGVRLNALEDMPELANVQVSGSEHGQGHAPRRAEKNRNHLRSGHRMSAGKSNRHTQSHAEQPRAASTARTPRHHGQTPKPAHAHAPSHGHVGKRQPFGQRGRGRRGRQGAGRSW